MSLTIDERRANTTRTLINEGRSASKLINRMKLLGRVTQEGQVSGDTKEGANGRAVYNSTSTENIVGKKIPRITKRDNNLLKWEKLLTLKSVDGWSL